MDYQEFKKEYEQSGLTQKRYSKQRGISPSMVSYYLRKAREENEFRDDKAQEASSKFSELQIISTRDKLLRITYPSGIQIELPI